MILIEHPDLYRLEAWKVQSKWRYSNLVYRQQNAVKSLKSIMKCSLAHN